MDLVVNNKKQRFINGVLCAKFSLAINTCERNAEEGLGRQGEMQYKNET